MSATTDAEGRQLYGLLAEFEKPGDLLEAAEKVRDEGFSQWDCYSPFPVHGLDDAMGLEDTRLPWVVLGAGATGLTVAILMQWWMNAVDYQLNISGKPLFSLPAQIPIAFELTVLFSAICAVLCMFAFNKLPQFYHPLFKSNRFKRVTNDRFFIAIETTDPKFDIERTEAFLRTLTDREIEWLVD
jgi:hypothetical protein